MKKAAFPNAILVALDESVEVAQAAVDLARATGASLTALFVLDDGWNLFTGSDWLSGSGSRADYLEYARDAEFAEGRQAVAALREMAGDLPVKVLTPAGLVLDTLLEEAGRGHDLLVVGVPFARGLEKYRDAPQQILKRAPCSVCFVRKA